jgi:hypothetical protein
MSLLTLHNLVSFNYDLAIKDLIFIRVNITQGQGRGLQLISEPVYFIRVTIYPGGGGRRLTATISTYLFFQVH